MESSRTVFAQVMSFLSHREFQQCVDRYGGNRGVRQFSCWDQFLTMAFAQLTYRASLRDIEVCLRAQRDRLYHSGLRTIPKRSTLADANERRDWRIYRDVAMQLIDHARVLYAADPISDGLDRLVYAFDSTTIDLCLSLYPWAKHHATTSAVKMHTLLDVSTSIPAWIAVTPAVVADVTMLGSLHPERGSTVIFDRGYLDFEQLGRLDRAGIFFVIRAKRGLSFQRRYSAAIDTATGVRSDQLGVLRTPHTRQKYPNVVRRVTYYSQEIDKYFCFLTNNVTASAEDIAELYRRRWRVELFFKWIKSHLRITSFFGTSENAVKTQIWIAIATYVLIAIIKKKMDISHSLYTMLQTLSLTLFEKMPIESVFQQLKFNSTEVKDFDPGKQLILFDLGTGQ